MNLTSVSLVLQLDLVFKLLIAFIAGLIIGLNRSYSGKAAGIRTQMLICVGSALIAGISVHLKDIFFTPISIVRTDPATLMAGIVTGIGFVGGGVILKSDKKILGVTTAATIWTSAVVGIAIGTGFILPAFLAVGFVLLLDPLSRLEASLGLKDCSYKLIIDVASWIDTQDILNNLAITYTFDGKKEDKMHLTLFSSARKIDYLKDNLKNSDIKHRLIELSS